MRWEALFADLQAQAAGQDQEEFEAHVAEVVELEWSRVELVDRLRGHIGRRIGVRLQGGESLTLDVETVGSDWMAGVGGGAQWLIPCGAISVVSGLTRRVRPETSRVRARLGIASPLRVLAEGRYSVVVRGETGILAEGALLGVGKDFIDVRSEAVDPLIRTVPLRALTAVCSARS